MFGPPKYERFISTCYIIFVFRELFNLFMISFFLRVFVLFCDTIRGNNECLEELEA
jgi:hypothetical protein